MRHSMSVLAQSGWAVRLQDVLADVRRKLESMATATVPPEVEEWRKAIAEGSSWAALQMALHIRPLNLRELLQRTGVYGLPAGRRAVAFNACADGYAVFQDGRLRRSI